MNWLVLTIATGVTVWLLPGITIVGDNQWLSYGSFALFMALINISIKPIMHILTLPISILTFGLMSLVVNTICFALASSLSNNIFGVGIASSSTGWSFAGAIVLSIIASLLHGLEEV